MIQKKPIMGPARKRIVPVVPFTGNYPKMSDVKKVQKKIKRARKSQKVKGSFFKNKLALKACTEAAQYAEEMTFLVDLACTLLSDIQTKLSTDVYRQADLHRDQFILKDMVRGQGITALCVEVPALVSAFMRYLETGVSDYPDTFPKIRNRPYPRLFSGLTRFFYEEECISAKLETDLVEAIYQIGSLLKKLKGPYGKEVLTDFVKDMIATDEALEGFHSEFHKPELQAIMLHATREAHLVLSELSPYDPYTRDLFVPRPGPGGVAIPTPKHKRFSPKVLYRSIDSVMPYREWFAVTLGDIIDCDFSHRIKVLYENAEDEPYSRFEAVPKTFGKPRGICLEMNEVQVLQQALRRALYYWLEHWHPLTRGRVSFEDQSNNGRLALESSENQEFDTLDLKDGSQRILARLCFHLYGELPIWPYLNALATKKILISPPYVPKKIWHRPRHYAPMGSALCFPVMSMTLYFLCRAIIAVKCPPIYKKFMDRVYVYGDDIIVPYDVSEAVREWLPRFGVKLNLDKSYHHSLFRESCGVHAYRGKDITPTYVRDIPAIHHSPISSLHSAVAAERGLNTAGYFQSAKWIRDHVHTVLGETLPEVWEKSVRFGWVREHRISEEELQRLTKRKWNKDEQQWFFRVLASKSVTRDKKIIEEERYLRYLWTYTRYAGPSVKEDPMDTFQWVWVAHSAL